MGTLPKAGRLALFYARLADFDPAPSIAEASRLVGDTLDRIEDEFSGIPRGDGTWDDGRMYAPRLDNRRAVPGRPDLVRDRSKNHNTYTYYSTSGAILIVTIEGKVEFSKAGLDGKGIEL